CGSHWSVPLQPPIGTHGLPTPGRSSTLPLQSLSRPSHTSGDGPLPPMQVRTPPEHCMVPAVHTPTPHLPDGQQGWLAPITLSICPSQSLSTPSQISFCGVTSPTQAPYCAACGHIIAVHFCRPPRQMPTPLVPLGPE